MLDWSAALHLTLAVSVGLPLIYAGTSKLLEAGYFVQTLPKFGIGLLRPTLATVRAVGVFELIAGATMLLGITGTAALTGVAYGCLTVLMARAVHRGSAGDCGCFGALSARIDNAAVVRNGVLAAASIAIAWVRWNEFMATYDARVAVVVAVACTLGSAAVETVLHIRRTAGHDG